MKKKTEVAIEVAAKEVEKWLDAKRVNEKHRDANEDSINSLTDAFANGSLSLDEKNNITMNLTWPVGVDDKIVELKFKPRLSVGEIHNNMKGIKSTNADARILAYVATLTEQPSGVIRQMDTEDYRVASSIVVFFF